MFFLLYEKFNGLSKKQGRNFRPYSILLRLFGGKQHDQCADRSTAGGDPQHHIDAHEATGGHGNHITDGNGACQVALGADRILFTHDLTCIGNRSNSIQTIANDLRGMCQINVHGAVGKGHTQALQEEHKAGDPQQIIAAHFPGQKCKA